MIVINNYCFYKSVNQALFVFLYSKIELAEFIKCEKDSFSSRVAKAMHVTLDEKDVLVYAF